MGDGARVRLVQDPWVGFMGSFVLLRDVIEHLNNRGLHFLNQVADSGNSSIWRQEWLSGNALFLEERWFEEWENYRSGLLNSHI